MHLVIRHGPSFISVIVKRLPVRFILHFRNFMNVKRKGAPVQFSAFHPISPSKISFPLLPLIGPYVKPQTCCTAAAAKSLQSCSTLCDPTDGSPPGSTIPGIHQARTLEWVAILLNNSNW